MPEPACGFFEIPNDRGQRDRCAEAKVKLAIPPAIVYLWMTHFTVLTRFQGNESTVVEDRESGLVGNSLESHHPLHHHRDHQPVVLE
jgi:hypothetical protein